MGFSLCEFVVVVIRAQLASAYRTELLVLIRARVVFANNAAHTLAEHQHSLKLPRGVLSDKFSFGS